jgi:hypothetical protein
MTTHQKHFPVSRRTALAGLGAGSLGLALTARSGVAQDAAADAMANHPIVGAWLTMNPGDPPSASPVSFTADGVMTVAWAPSYVDPQLGTVFQGTAIGAWEPTGERSIRFTIVQALSDADGAYLGTFTLEGYPEVSEDGRTFLDDGTRAKATVRDANNTVTFEAGGGEGEAPMTPPVPARRIQAGDAGFPEGTPTAGTPAP